ncbi:MAG: hypothetical protein ICV68_02275 [Pyrinomonadaceae bacterium]|nr:hypothetical protein [Pyrinomonadaceae bacterium]
MSKALRKTTVKERTKHSKPAVADAPAGKLVSVKATRMLDGDMDDQRSVFTNSILAAEAFDEWSSVLRELQKAQTARILFFTTPEGGEISLDEAMNRACDPYPNESTKERINNILRQPVTSITWIALDELFRRSPAAAKEVWDLVKQEARKEFESGHRAAEVFERAPWQRETWNRARYLGIRDSFIEQWQPRGGIDLAMIDMLTQSFYFYLYWTEIANLRTETEMRGDPPEWVQARRQMERTFPRDRSGMKGFWDPPYAKDQEAVEHATLMAERYSKAFQRNLRAMRDLRRYTMPVTINNPQQVNIAADGGQQMNVTRKEK